MALEADRIAEAHERIGSSADRRATSERRGRDRRQAGSRINQKAPRQSLMRTGGAVATGLSASLFGVTFAASLVLETTPWIALGVTGTVTVVSVFAMLLGCIEQRLIEIRLELMMANGGMRQAHRRRGARRAEEGRGAIASGVSAPESRLTLAPEAGDTSGDR